MRCGFPGGRVGHQETPPNHCTQQSEKWPPLEEKMSPISPQRRPLTQSGTGVVIRSFDDDGTYSVLEPVPLDRTQGCAPAQRGGARPASI